MRSMPAAPAPGITGRFSFLQWFRASASAVRLVRALCLVVFLRELEITHKGGVFAHRPLGLSGQGLGPRAPMGDSAARPQRACLCRLATDAAGPSSFGGGRLRAYRLFGGLAKGGVLSALGWKAREKLAGRSRRAAPSMSVV